MVLLLSEGAASDAAARDRLAGEVNEMHIDTVLARGGQGQDTGRLGRRFVAPDTRSPPTPDPTPRGWRSPTTALPRPPPRPQRVLDTVELAALEPLGSPTGPDYRLPWIDRVRPGVARLGRCRGQVVTTVRAGARSSCPGCSCCCSPRSRC